MTDTLPAGVTFVSATGTGWTCTNAGNVSATCTRPALATGTTAPAITVTVTAPAFGTTLTDTAVVSSTTPDPNAANNTSTVTTTVGPVADLAITKSGPATVVAGAGVTLHADRHQQRPLRRGQPLGHRHAAGRRDVRVRDRHRLVVLQQRQRLGDVHPGDPDRRRRRRR